MISDSDIKAIRNFAGTIYFQKGWIGRPWDNFYRASDLKFEGERLELTGDAWKLVVEKPEMTQGQDYIALKGDSLNFFINEIAFAGDKLGNKVLLYMDNAVTDLSTILNSAKFPS